MTVPSPTGDGGQSTTSGSTITISVVLPVYNAAKNLRRSVETLMSFWDRPDEIIIVNDGSTDDTPSVADSLRQPGVLAIHHPSNHGVPAALNTGLKWVRTSHVVFPAVGDVVLGGLFNRGRKLLSDFPVGMFCSTGIWQDWHGLRWTMGRIHDRLFVFRPGDPPPAKVAPLSHTAIIDTGSLRRIGGYPEHLKWHADWWVTYKIALEYGFVFAPECYSHVFLEKQSYSSGMRGSEQQKVLGLLMDQLLCDARFLHLARQTTALGDFGLPFSRELWRAGGKPSWRLWKAAAIRSLQLLCRRRMPPLVQEWAIRLFLDHPPKEQNAVPSQKLAQNGKPDDPG